MQIQALAGLGTGAGSTQLRDSSGACAGAESNGAASRSFKPAAGKLEAAQAALHDAFAKRGCDTLLRLGKKFHVMDDDDSQGLSYEEARRLSSAAAVPVQHHACARVSTS
jgi:hypothetical protein